MGGDPSSRKSSKKEFAARLLDCDECPEELRNGLCTCADGTIKGVRTGIENYNRSGVESDEVSNTYETPFSEQGKGIHYLGRSKMATYVNCEKDSSMTGLGNTTLSAYSFMHRVSGQTEAVECAVRPTIGGFQKRFHLTFSGPFPRCDDTQSAATSKQFLRDFHVWMCRHALTCERVHTPDVRALSLFRAVQRAVEAHVQAEQGGDAENRSRQFYKQKLMFLDTDLVKFSSAIMRMVQFISAVQNPLSHERATFTVYELMHALHNWRRQLAFHKGKGCHRQDPSLPLQCAFPAILLIALALQCRRQRRGSLART